MSVIWLPSHSQPGALISSMERRRSSSIRSLLMRIRVLWAFGAAPTEQALGALAVNTDGANPEAWDTMCIAAKV